MPITGKPTTLQRIALNCIPSYYKFEVTSMENHMYRKVMDSKDILKLSGLWNGSHCEIDQSVLTNGIWHLSLLTDMAVGDVIWNVFSDWVVNRVY